jgi:diketogulonate reductase-like aldo/keto reductase
MFKVLGMLTQLSLPHNQFMPSLGFGTWKLQGDDCFQAVSKALQVGYRHIDTAHAYQNHVAVGSAIANSSIPREKLFITSKIWRLELSPEQVEPTLIRALQELQTDYLDMYLIHWPNHEVPLAETLLAMDQMRKQGLVKNIGVSNFTIHHLREALKADVQIATNQVEFHPTLNQSELVEFCKLNNISVTAYSPLAQGYDLKLPIVQELSRKYGRPPSQIVLNWILSKDIAAIPRAGNPVYIEENFGATEFAMEPKDLDMLDQQNQDYRVVNPTFAEFHM